MPRVYLGRIPDSGLLVAEAAAAAGLTASQVRVEREPSGEIRISKVDPLTQAELPLSLAERVAFLGIARRRNEYVP